MTELYEKKCIPCEGNTPAFDYSEIHRYLKKITTVELLLEADVALHSFVGHLNAGRLAFQNHGTHQQAV